MVLIHPAPRPSPFLRKMTCESEEWAGVEGGDCFCSALLFSSSVTGSSHFLLLGLSLLLCLKDEFRLDLPPFPTFSSCKLKELF